MQKKNLKHKKRRRKFLRLLIIFYKAVILLSHNIIATGCLHLGKFL